MSPANNHDRNVDGDMSADRTIAAKAKAGALDMLAYSQRQLDRIVAPSTRQRAMDSTTAFATKRPLLSLFIATQILSALVPLLLFATFVLSALVLALLSTLAFTLFWTLVALVFLVPTLLLASGFALLMWLWAVGSYVVARAVYMRLPTSVRQATNAGGEKHIIFQRGFDLDETIAAEVAEARE